MHELIREIQALAQAGLTYSSDPFDQERYQRLRKIAFELLSRQSDASLSRVEQFFLPEEGYPTPKVDLRACVFKEEKVLLVKERSDDRWTVPGGWADQNESPREGIVREVREESGYDVAIQKLYAVKDRDRHAYTPKYPVSIYKLFFVGTVLGGRPTESIEISEVGFFALDSLPELSVSRVLAEDIDEGYRHFRSGELPVLVD